MQASLFYCASLVQGVGRGVGKGRSSTLPIRVGVVAGGFPEKRFIVTEMELKSEYEVGVR